MIDLIVLVTPLVTIKNPLKKLSFHFRLQGSSVTQGDSGERVAISGLGRVRRVHRSADTRDALSHTEPDFLLTH